MQNQGKIDAESTNATVNAGVTTPGGMNLLHRENYFSAGGFFNGSAMSGASLWVGQRFYNRHDVHMTDYYYWTDLGPGAGIEDINLGPAKLAFAYFQNGGNANALYTVDALGNPTTTPVVVGKRYSMRFYDINVNPNGKLEGELVALTGSSAVPNATKGSGQTLYLEHTQDGFLGGFNKLAFVVAKDLGYADAGGPTYQGGGVFKGSSWRIHEQLYFDFKGTGWTGTATISHVHMSNDATATTAATTTSWTSFGIRPQYNFTDKVSMAFEAGVDDGKGADGTNYKVNKLTIAPQLALTRGVWARPVLRAFVTFANWNDAQRNAGIANGVFGTKNSGTTMGFQAEAWW